MAWQRTPMGICEPDLAKSSEIEVTLQQSAGGLATVVVELEHRGLQRRNHRVVNQGELEPQKVRILPLVTFVQSGGEIAASL
jgi:hypothetical protein